MFNNQAILGTSVWELELPDDINLLLEDEPEGLPEVPADTPHAEQPAEAASSHEASEIEPAEDESLIGSLLEADEQQEEPKAAPQPEGSSEEEDVDLGVIGSLLDDDSDDDEDDKR